MKEIIIAVPDQFGQKLMPEKANCEIKGELVRCKDCIYHRYDNDRIPYCALIDYGYGWKDDEFCNRGKRW